MNLAELKMNIIVNSSKLHYIEVMIYNRVNLIQNCEVDPITLVNVSYLPSGGAWLFFGQPDKLLWWEYNPVIWPVPSQPGVGHFTSEID